jgi:hypothetical protein
MEPDPLLLELQAIHAAIDSQTAILTANAARDALWQTQALFFLEAQALALGIIWGAYVFRLCVLSKNQRSMFW